MLFLFAGSISAQEVQEKKEEETKLNITGSPIITVFANFHNGIGEHNDQSGFELTRAYLGYKFRLSPTVTGKAIIDAGIPAAESPSNDIALKNAMLSWQDKGFTINGGLISTIQFDLQEQIWQNRYISQTFQDLYKMGSSADLGISVACQLTKWIGADISFTNGEGYRKLNSSNNNYKFGTGITLTPYKGFIFRAYADTYDQDGKDDQQTLALFAGYLCEAFTLGTEYNYQANQRFTNGNDYYGYSVYSNVRLAKKWKIFARYDRIDSDKVEEKAWYMDARDLVIAGFEYRPLKQLRIAPNYKYALNKIIDGPVHEVYLNVGFNW